MLLSRLGKSPAKFISLLLTWIQLHIGVSVNERQERVRAIPRFKSIRIWQKTQKNKKKQENTIPSMFEAQYYSQQKIEFKREMNKKKMKIANETQNDNIQTKGHKKRAACERIEMNVVHTRRRERS